MKKLADQKHEEEEKQKAEEEQRKYEEDLKNGVFVPKVSITHLTAEKKKKRGILARI